MTADEIEIQIVAPIRVAYMRHVGPFGSPGIAETWRRFESWCEAEGLAPLRRRRFGVAQDNPNITPSERTRYDVCIQVDDDFHARGDVGVQTLPGGRYAFVPFAGRAAEIRAAWIWFLTRALPDAGLEPDLAPAIEIFAPAVAVDPATGAFSCLLCMSLRS
jgi:AraC family transcriptional regulator